MILSPMSCSPCPLPQQSALLVARVYYIRASCCPHAPGGGPGEPHSCSHHMPTGFLVSLRPSLSPYALRLMPSELLLNTAHFGKASFGLSEHQPLLLLDNTRIILVLSVSLAINLLKKKNLEGHYLILLQMARQPQKEHHRSQQEGNAVRHQPACWSSLMQGHCYSDRDQRLPVTKEPHPRGPGDVGQLLTCPSCSQAVWYSARWHRSFTRWYLGRKFSS